MRWCAPSQFIYCSARKDEGSTRLRTEGKTFAGCQDLVPGSTVHYDVEKVLHMFMPWNNAGRDAVVLECQTAPWDNTTAAGGRRRKKWLAPPCTNHLDAGNDRPIDLPATHCVVELKPPPIERANGATLRHPILLVEVRKICTSSDFQN
jgi:hypothetical protein